MSLTRVRANARARALAGVSLVAAASFFLTACNPDDAGAAADASAGASGKNADKAADKGKSDDEGGTDGTEAQTGEGSNVSGGKSGGKAVTGTWFGNVTYVAPGKYTVSDMKDTQQAFFTSTETDIQGAGKICGDAQGQAMTPCTEDQLEAASKKGVNATVKLKNGIAVSVHEDHSSTGGGDKATGTWSGDLGYMAPGKYTLVDKQGTKRAFFTSTDTDINGAGWICGDAEAQATTPCTEDQLETAAKKGIAVVVKLEKGIAVTIDEEHN